MALQDVMPGRVRDRDVARGLRLPVHAPAEYFANAKNPVSPRPTYSALNLAKIEATGLRVPDWEESLRAYVTKELNK